MRIAHWPTVISMLIGLAIFGIPTSADAARTVLCTSYTQCKATSIGVANQFMNMMTSLEAVR